MEELVKEFKERMKIFHDSENAEIERSLLASRASIKRMIGSDDITIPEIKELVIERSRYAYNDSLEFFEENFQSNIIGVMLEVAIENEDDVQTKEDNGR
ncbi:phage gp6-like head-tail connector protein [Vagococcus vulneris]|uniref:Phage gp6-like head-tail connector protein n=1 Tax=Vagococcus vulneris TaxID=1977869 RepID=A0A429ZT96_9ENTE|nr:phage gp6-like head-tail connector protein [Vagococcus vulneris]RST96947.1 hypothetical protein CBF37_10340 [Vagococcus vulneris]